MYKYSEKKIYCDLKKKERNELGFYGKTNIKTVPVILEDYEEKYSKY